ncbi:hypothetical protein B0H17DRAFT_1328978 [Mycena rosella]|uniref:Uncharacterized protein n=1 Tax=Mycena rosella TaxID=1033263 RepID=A0AAD7GP35_MYCRO|nr:hypothetical protein B0H17DRAFT_1328978 [Mycena rosella]
MDHKTTFTIETTGGSPVFHLPFPLASFAALAEDSDTGHVEFVFRNIGGTPTFHVGGSEVGVSPGDAWNYPGVVRRVMEARARAMGGEVTVKLEEGTPRIPAADKGKKKRGDIRRQAEDAEHRNEDPATTNSIPTDSQNETAGRMPRLPLMQSKDTGRNTADTTARTHEYPATIIQNENAAPPRTYSREEIAAMQRGSLSRSGYDEVLEAGRFDFALLCDPSHAPSRPLTTLQKIEWSLLWDALLHLDRVFTGPMRDDNAVKLRWDAMMAAAARRTQRGGEIPIRRARAVADDAPPAASGSDPRAENYFRTLLAASLNVQSSDTSDPSASGTRIKTGKVSPRDTLAPDPHESATREVVDTLRVALQPLQQAMQMRARTSQAIGSDSGSAASSVARALGMDGRSEWMAQSRSVKGTAPAPACLDRKQRAHADSEALDDSVVPARPTARPVNRSVKENAPAPADTSRAGKQVVPAPIQSAVAGKQRAEENRTLEGEKKQLPVVTSPNVTRRKPAGGRGERDRANALAGSSGGDARVGGPRKDAGASAESSRAGSKRVRTPDRDGGVDPDAQPKRARTATSSTTVPAAPVTEAHDTDADTPAESSRASLKRTLPPIGGADADVQQVKSARTSASSTGSMTGVHTLKLAYTPSMCEYTAWIPAAAPNADTPILTDAERAWLARQVDLASDRDRRACARPVRWLELGERMYVAATEEDGVRPLYHGVLLRAWDRGEWRFPGQEAVGRVGVPWHVWVSGEKGRRWREGGM